MKDEQISRELERRLAQALRAAAPRPAPDLADRCLRRTAAERQARGWGLAFAPALAAAAVVVLAIVAGLQLGTLLNRGDVAVGSSSPSASARPLASPSPTATVTPSPSATDEIFPGGSQCTNVEIGFTVGYPAGWWANEEVVPDDPAGTPIPACRYFAEEPAELRPNSEVPDAVSILSALSDVPLGNPEQLIEVISTRQTEVAGRPAVVEEIRWTEDAFLRSAGDRDYAYRIELPDGRTLSFGTSSRAVLGAYEDHKRILDQMMETLELDEG